MNRAKLAYKPLGALLGAAAGLAAGAVFSRVWRATTGSDHVPRATEEHQRWAAVLLAAALQGAVFAVVKAAVDRGSAQGMKRITGQWPD
ncbi:DUF4235 domain-containing protein [Natronosporangium hydrolyticum]|uniref:DUF4235 domain-containing protein n=1 Tax=Natronosporangium hydrolyticum TaxID=2811111 RepID=A0A895YS42_9ACTN|nr:DUF4235 domain-containing protein [Natronosporangium hydrolyticum]QSB16920.1 DUF4235 domain-containing protein [Natronosporangium hydrolyticum]